MEQLTFIMIRRNQVESQFKIVNNVITDDNGYDRYNLL